MRVLLVMTARELGGAELYVERLVSALADRCRFIVALSNHPNIMPLRRRLADKAEVHAFDFDRALALPGVAGALRRLAAGCDVIHLNSNHPGSRLGIFFGFALPGSGTPVVVVEHSATPIASIVVPGAVAWSLPALFRLSRRRIAAIVAVSQQNRDVLVDSYHLAAGRIRVINNGADLAALVGLEAARGQLRSELGLGSDQPIVMTLARVAPNKGHRTIVEAAPAIVGRHPGAHFVFAGVLDQPEPVTALIAQRGLAQHFTLLGFRSDVPELLAGSDIFVLPSLGEGFSLSIVEAMAAGLPVIATRVGGAAEIIDDGRNGVLIPPADAPALARAVNRVLDMAPAEREQMQQAARTTAAAFSAQAMADRTFALYRQVASRTVS